MTCSPTWSTVPAEGARFGGNKICPNQQVRSDLLETGVWEDVCAVLTDPQKVEAEYRRRLEGKDGASRSATGPSLRKLIQKVKRSIARLIDAYDVKRQFLFPLGDNYPSR